MEEINFNCPHCKVNLQAEKELAGQIIECPNCSAQVTVPEPQNEIITPETETEEQKIISDSPSSRKSAGKQYTSGEDSISASPEFLPFSCWS